MATTKKRLKWRYGGGSAQAPGVWQSLVVKEEDYERAKLYVEVNAKRVTSAELELFLLPEAAKLSFQKYKEEQEADKAAGPRLSELIPGWFDALHSVEINTKNKYRTQIEYLVEVTGDKRVREITKRDINLAVAGLLKNVTQTTVERYISAWRRFFNLLIEDGALEENPAARIKLKRGAGKSIEDKHFYMSGAQFNLLLGCTDERYRLLLDFLANTGARFSEAAAMTPSALQLAGDSPAIVIRAAYKKGDGSTKYVGDPKSGSIRRIAINPVLAKRLLIATEGMGAKELIFASPENTPLDNSNFRKRYWDKAVYSAMRCADHPPLPGGQLIGLENLKGPRCRDNGGSSSNGTPCGSFVVPGYNRCKDHYGISRTAVSTCSCSTRLPKFPTPHDLRHTHAANQIKEGRTAPAIARRLGHGLNVFTKIYAGILPDVADSLGELNLTELDY